MSLLNVQDLAVRFHTLNGVIHAVNGLSFDLEVGETLAIVGESGCGKSVTVRSILGLIPEPPGEIASGSANYKGEDLFQLSGEEIRVLRGSEIAMTFQDPMTSLNPLLSIRRQLTEPLRTHLKMDAAAANKRAVELLNMVGIPDPEARLHQYPHQFSGGMRQRVMIAMALACGPQIWIADEPTTALDVTIQAQIIDLVKQLRQELEMAIIWITHDLGVVAGFAHRVLVMYAGFGVEHAQVRELYANPQHPYTLGLLGSLPRVDLDDLKPLTNIPGMPPSLLAPSSGCPFAPRCPFAFDRCLEENPPLMEIASGHEVACWWDIDKEMPR